MKKFLVLALALVLMMSVFVGCTPKEETPPPDDNAVDDSADVVTTASIVDNGQAVVNGLSTEGTWIVCTLNDITLEEDIVVAGQFHDKDDETKPLYRKLALYTQDEDHNITDSFNLTAPKMVVQSENFKIQGGTFVGDVYVEANGFSLTSAVVEGNVYYASQEMMDSAVIDAETAEITGVQEVKAAE